MKHVRLLRPLINTQIYLGQKARLHKSGCINVRKNHSLMKSDENQSDKLQNVFQPDVASLSKSQMNFTAPSLIIPKYIEKIGTVSRRFKWENPGENRAMIASYLEGSYTGSHAHYLQEYPELNRYQRKVMFDKEYEKFIFSENPANYTPEEFGFSQTLRIPRRQLKIKLIKPSDIVYYHDLCEMWKRRQQIDMPFINVGSYVQIKAKSGYPAQPSLTFSGLCIMKYHRDMHAYVTLRRSYASQTDDAVEKTYSLYSPWIESIKVLSYQVRCQEDLRCVRDFDIKQSKLPHLSHFPQPEFLPNGVEIPKYVPQVVKWRRYRKSTRSERKKMWAKAFKPPGRAGTLRLHKMWLPEHDPERTYIPHYKIDSRKK